jgi:hypothetical protein
VSIENEQINQVELPNSDQETGWYERTVGKITNAVKPYLHEKTTAFVEKSVDKYAKDNPRLAKMIEFEVKRRGDGAGLTQDVAEPLLWAGIKTVAALAISALTETLNKGKFKLVGRVAALGIVLNNAVELFRLVPRYIAGLQGSLEMAKDRWRSIEQTGVDPFDHGGRLIHKAKDHVASKLVPDDSPDEPHKFWTLENKPKTLLEMAVTPPEMAAVPSR